MKILYVHRTGAQDGSSVHIDGLIGALRAQGAEVVLLAPRVVGPVNNGFLARLRRALPRALHEVLEFVYNVPEMFQLARAVRTHCPDVVYERSNVFLLAPTLVAARARCPRIIEVNAPYAFERARHGGLTFKSLARWSEETAWQRADAVIAVTGELGRMIERAGVGRDRIHVMGNGVDMTLCGAVDASDLRGRLGWTRFTVLGFTGFVRDWNGLTMVIDLLAQPGNEALALLVVGDGPARSGLTTHADALGVSSRVRFTGRVTPREVAEFVSAFDIALQPAANPYASPLKLVEYMAYGRAIIAPDQSNIREVLEHNVNALLFDPNDPAAFAAAVRRLVDDTTLRQRLAQAALETVRRRDLTWTHNARRVLELAQRLVQAHAATRSGASLPSIRPR